MEVYRWHEGRSPRIPNLSIRGRWLLRFTSHPPLPSRLGGPMNPFWIWK